jgi:ATP-binding protein involved in chromosome partitioning
MSLTESQILDALRVVIDPDLHKDIVSLGFVKQVEIEGSKVSAVIQLTTPACPVKDILEQQCRDAISGIDGVEEVNVEMTAAVRPRQTPADDLLPGVKQVIAIASGKGGVGKSTVSVNLAVALADAGAKVGLMDADVYGPSIPMMMGCPDLRPFQKGGKILPITKHGISLMSLGFLMEPGQAVIWRGPMVAGTVRQLLSDVDWGELDYLLVDLPPGTGDAPMTLAQMAPLAGVVIVTTPHHVAANIAGKSVVLFRRLNAPILGVVENMALYVCPSCGARSRIFAGLSGEQLAEEYKVPFLGSVPLDPQISTSGDEGIPAVRLHPESAYAEAFRDIAGTFAQQVSIRSFARKDVIRIGESA